MSNNNKGREIFYGVIGVATLVVAIIGATFAYFTASANNNTTIRGNTAKVALSLSVKKVSTAGDSSGIIPMTNSMVEKALAGKTGNANVCLDDNGNAVCQIYEITLTNNSTTSVFVDGYVTLKGGSGVPADYTSYTGSKFEAGSLTTPSATEAAVHTTMRWAQVIKGGTAPDGADATYSTAGNFQLGLVSDEKVTFTSIGLTTESSGSTAALNRGNIRDSYTTATDEENNKGVLKQITINADADAEHSVTGDVYDVIGKNYIRVSNHTWQSDTAKAEVYDRTADVTSALVFNHYVADETADSANVRKYYIVVWLSENGINQTAGSGGTGVPTTGLNFFAGNVTFVSSQGNEVSATFQSYARVTSDQTTPRS